MKKAFWKSKAFWGSLSGIVLIVGDIVANGVSIGNISALAAAAFALYGRIVATARSGSAISRRPTSSKQKRTCARARQRWMQTTATRPLRAPVGTGGQCFNTALPSPRPQRGFCSHARKENRSPRARARDALAYLAIHPAPEASAGEAVLGALASGRG